VKIRTKLLILLCIPLIGLGVFWAMSQRTLSRVQVGGPVYGEVVAKKDLIADILPPPLYIIESYLTVMRIEEERDNPAVVRALMGRMTKLQEEYAARHEHWVKALGKDDSLRGALLESAHEPAQRFFQLWNTVGAAAVAKGDWATLDTLLAEQLAPAYAQHRAAVDEAVSMANAALIRSETEAATYVAYRTWWLVGVAVTAAAMSFGLGYWVAMGITRRLNGIRSAMAALAEGHGDLTRRLPAGGSDEIADVARLTNGFVANVHDIVASISNASGQVIASTDTLTETTKQMTAMIDENNSRTMQVSAAVDELSASVSQVAESSKSAADNTTAAAEQAQSGGDVVSVTVNEIRAISDMVKASSGAITKLGGLSQRIGDLVTVINDIAEQTNLLALNAAIEAARAGEHGRGFAVVADEVRKLADRTTKATEEIASTVREIRTDTDHAVGTMEQCSSSVDTGVEMAEKAGTALQEIMQSATSMTGVISAIAYATNEQNKAIGDVCENISSMAKGVSAATNTASRASNASEVLRNQASVLAEVVGRFRIDADAVRQRAIGEDQTAHGAGAEEAEGHLASRGG
jgi:methyl-accepting chemotaxis protein